MPYIRTIIGTAIAGIFVMSIWGTFSANYGIGGGWFAGFVIISITWFLNHYLGIISNPQGATPVDQALAIGVTGTMRDVFLAGSITPLVESMPTLVLVVFGGVAGAVCAVAFQRNIEEINQLESGISTNFGKREAESQLSTNISLSKN